MINVDVVEEQKAKSSMAFHKTLEKIHEQIKDFSPIWKLFLPEYQTLIASNFNTLGQLFGNGKWEALRSSKYKKWKEKKGRLGIANLQLEGNLRTAAVGGKNSYTEIDKDEMIIGIKNIEYANVHQFGYKNIPARPYLFRNDKNTLSKKGMVKLIEIANKELLKAVE